VATTFEGIVPCAAAGCGAGRLLDVVVQPDHKANDATAKNRLSAMRRDRGHARLGSTVPTAMHPFMFSLRITGWSCLQTCQKEHCSQQSRQGLRFYLTLLTGCVETDRQPGRPPLTSG
jgi:hypothetical protein